MKITKQRFGYVLKTGYAVIVFDDVLIDTGNIPDITLEYWGSVMATIPNQHIKEFEQKFTEAGGVIE